MTINRGPGAECPSFAGVVAARHAVEVRPVAEVTSLAGWDAVVLGAPINGMRLVPEMTSFIAAREAELRGLRTALYAVSYMHGAARPRWSRAIESSTSDAAARAGAGSWKVLTGRIEKRLPGFARAIFGLPQNAPLDRRDPATAAAWAREIATTFGS